MPLECFRFGARIPIRKSPFQGDLSNLPAALQGKRTFLRSLTGWVSLFVWIPLSLIVGLPDVHATSAASVAKVTSFEVRRVDLEGNTALSSEAISRLTRSVIGPQITLSQLRGMLADLQQAYREIGFPNVAITLPRQALVDGVVRVRIVEGEKVVPETSLSTGSSTGSRSNISSVVQAPPPPRTFEVRRYEVIGNTLLSNEIISGILTNATGPKVSLPQIQKALGDLQLAYRERGFATVAVSLPQQQLTNAMVRVQVTEGVLSSVRVSGNRHFSSNNVFRALPSLRTNTQLNSLVFQRELDLANQNRDRQIFPTIGPGAEPGTSSLNLRVKDRLPLHGRLDLNNHSTPGTPDWRINASAQYGNLWQREHQVGLSYGFTPEQYKASGVVADYLVNRPLIANYGAYYRLPFGSPSSLQEQIDSSSGRFGYNEATKQFNLPPPGSRPDLTVFASGSSSDTGVKAGPASLVSQSPLLTIVSQDTGQNISINESVGARVGIPWALGDSRRISFSGGLDLKRYLLQSYNTNNFLFTSVITNALGSQTNLSRTASPQPGQSQEILYLPLSVGADYSQVDPGGTFSAGLNLSWNVFGETENIFASTNRSSRDLSYGKATLTLVRDQKIFKTWSLVLRASGQLTTDSLISNEQFALGGVNSIRGYYEGDEYGDAAWNGSIELRTPYLTARVPTWSDPVPAWLRGSIFLDGGQRFLMDAPSGSKATRSLLGTGLGVSGSLNNSVEFRLILGWPLRDSANTAINDPRAYLSIGGQF